MGKPEQKTLEIANPNAAGIDIGDTEHWVTVPSDRDAEPIKKFGTFTEDLLKICKWLKKCRIDTVAMESTGVYWLQLYLLLEEQGFEVFLVNAKFVKNVSGRKFDDEDSEWIQRLHSFGLLNNSFQPVGEIRELRDYTRQRKQLIQGASREIQHMQKALEQMNIKLHTVISDLTGVSGRRIVEAILDGNRDASYLSGLVDSRVKASNEEIKKSLTGYWRKEYLFELKQANDLYQYYNEKIKECDNEIEKALQGLIIEDEPSAEEEKKSKKNKKRQKNQPSFNMSHYLEKIYGVDVTEIYGISSSTGLEILSETGCDMTKWKTSKHFVSWLGLAPNNKHSGGKLISSHVPKKKNRAGQAFRTAASTLARSKNELGDFYRRIRFQGGPKQAVVATARKIAVIFYNMVLKCEKFRPIGNEKYQEQYKDKKINYLMKQLKQFGITPAQLVVAS
jgi:transposase